MGMEGERGDCEYNEDSGGREERRIYMSTYIGQVGEYGYFEDGR